MPVNYYEVLDISQNSSQEEIKKSYQNLVLSYHPDKQLKLNSIFTEKFILIDEAYKVLRDVELRKVYDSELLQSKFNGDPIIFDTLSKDDLSYDEQNDEYFYICRCGGVYIITDNFIKDSNGNDCFISCDECSLVIKLNNKKIN